MVFHIHEHKLYIHGCEHWSSMWTCRAGLSHKRRQTTIIIVLHGGYYLISNSVTQSVLIAAFVNIKH